jgi:small conductance mechanosensitive channel
MQSLISAATTIVIAIVIYQAIRIPLNKLKRSNVKVSNGKTTYFSFIGSFVRVIYISVVILVLLHNFGIDVSNLLAGIGIASVAIGLAVQDTLKDIIRGISIVSDDYYKVGETVTIGDVTGKVLSVGIRSTKLQDLGTGNVITLANRNIERSEVAGTKFGIDIPLPYELKLEKAEAIMNEIAEKAVEHEDIQELKYVGVSELAASSINYKLFGSSVPRRRIQAKRAVLHVALEVLEKHKVDVPYPQMDVHQK